MVKGGEIVDRIRKIAVSLMFSIILVAGILFPMFGYGAREVRGYITLSFDDGLLNQYTYAYPLMRSRHMHGVFNVITALIGSSNRMTYTQLLRLQNSGNEITSHSHTHPYFTKLTESEIRIECSKSKQLLSEHGINVVDFVYPYGNGNNVTDSIVAEYYRSARRGYSIMSVPHKGFLVTGWTSCENTDSEDFRIYKGVIDKMVNQNGWCILYFHGVEPNNASGTTISTSAFQRVLDYISASNVKVVTMSEMLGIPPSNNDEMTGARWSKVPSPTNATLKSVAMVSSTDGWAVGFDGTTDCGTIIRWDGTSWKNVTSPTSAFLICVDMVSSNEGYAIAFDIVSPLNESVIRWDGANWSNVTTIPGYFRSVDMVSSTEGWAVGYGAYIMRWDGTSWSRVEGPTNYSVELRGEVIEVPFNYPLESVDMVSSTEGWAVGEKAVIIRWNGTTWTLARGPELAGAPWLWSVDMVSSTEGWAVGSGGDIMRWDGTSWEYVTSPTTKHLFSVNMVDSTDGWAVGSDGCIIHWDGTSWSNVASPTTAWLNSIDMVSSTEGWIVGADGNIYRWQEEEAPDFPIAYSIIIGAIVVAVVVLFFLRKRSLKKKNL
jgi:peptidoglycan/xylan/chitin deacetylase (PgdA/CDA1 family)/photosystem II stability/assembly factor-like uncharacterized protein